MKLYQFLQTEKKKIVLSKQLLKSGTSVGAMIMETEYSESKADFIHKTAIVQKEINETLYWLELFLKETGYITLEQYERISSDAIEIIKFITSIIKTTNQNLTGNN